jgi:hypothetical protein
MKRILMSELLKALQNLPTKKEKIYTVCIMGKDVSVTLEQKLEVLKHGEDAYHWVSADNFELKPAPKKKTQFSVLKKTRKGYVFQSGDIHWPNAVIDGGESWQIESE